MVAQYRRWQAPPRAWREALFWILLGGAGITAQFFMAQAKGKSPSLTPTCPVTVTLAHPSGNSKPMPLLRKDIRLTYAHGQQR